ncbi:high-affinity hexose transporter Hxt7p [[Candida] anglica]|uniref:High-affinity hexose transporter Hxt7p n=1 Tax=[Candida] anglica TaxID=148631 RepID=A0ABP0EFV1_9ASCO
MGKENDSVSIESVSSTPGSPNEKTVVKQEKKKEFRWRVVDNESPPEIYNKTLYLSVFVFGVLGSARGFDEGCISGTVAQKSFIEEFGLKSKLLTLSEQANLKSNITSMVQLGSIGGSALAMWTVDRFGRIRTLQGVCVLWIAAAIIQATSHSVGQLYAGRLIEGFAIGQTTTIGPTYMSEVAPKAIRGLCGCIFAGAVYFGIMTAYFANYGTALHVVGRNQWVIPTSMKCVLAFLILVGSTFLCVESPRWLMKIGNDDKAAKNLSRLRGLPVDHPYILSEIADINEHVLREKEQTSGNTILGNFREIIMTKSIRYPFFAVCCMSQLLGQWSGANAITIYSPELMALAGAAGTEKLKMTAVLGVVKFISAYLSAFFIIDFLGRRRALYIGITVQLISILYFAIFLTIVPEAEEDHPNLSNSQFHAAQAALAALFLSGTGWTMGFNSIQYLIGSEMFPLRIRSFAQSLVMVLHFANQYGNSKALPKMLLAMDNYGAFYFFVAVLACSLFWAYFFIPEVSGRSLESIEEIFSLPWYLVGRRGAELCPDHSEINRVTHNEEGNGNAHGGHIDYETKPSEEFLEDVEDEGVLKRANNTKSNGKN